MARLDRNWRVTARGKGRKKIEPLSSIRSENGARVPHVFVNVFESGVVAKVLSILAICLRAIA